MPIQANRPAMSASWPQYLLKTKRRMASMQQPAEPEAGQAAERAAVRLLTLLPDNTRLMQEGHRNSGVLHGIHKQPDSTLPSYKRLNLY